MLDAVVGQLGAFKSSLGAGDKARIDTYVDNIRELERRIRIAMDNSVKEPAADVPFGLPQSKHEHFRLMYDLMALAFEGDITRSITFMLGRDLSGASFPESGFNGGWHGTSHHGDKPENIANYAKVNRYHVQNLAYFCEKLSKIPDGDGTVLDHVLIYKGSNMGNSHRHAHEKVPVDSRRRHRRHVQGQPASGVPRQHAADVEHAAQPPAPLRDRDGQDRDEHRAAAAAGNGVTEAHAHGDSTSSAMDARSCVGGRRAGVCVRASPVAAQLRPRDAAAGRPAAGTGAAGDLQELHVAATASTTTPTTRSTAPAWDALLTAKHRGLDVPLAGAGAGDPAGLAGGALRPDHQAVPARLRGPGGHDVLLRCRGEALLKRACTSCHALDRVNSARFAPERWRVVTWTCGSAARSWRTRNWSGWSSGWAARKAPTTVTGSSRATFAVGLVPSLALVHGRRSASREDAGAEAARDRASAPDAECAADDRAASLVDRRRARAAAGGARRRRRPQPAAAAAPVAPRAADVAGARWPRRPRRRRRLRVRSPG